MSHECMHHSSHYRFIPHSFQSWLLQLSVRLAQFDHPQMPLKSAIYCSSCRSIHILTVLKSLWISSKLSTHPHHCSLAHLLSCTPILRTWQQSNTSTLHGYCPSWSNTSTMDRPTVLHECRTVYSRLKITNRSFIYQVPVFGIGHTSRNENFQFDPLFMLRYWATHMSF